MERYSESGGCGPVLEISSPVEFSTPCPDFIERGPSPRIPEVQNHAARRGAHILVVEDTPCVAMVIERILVDAGYVVTLAATGREAVESLAQERADLVLLDVDLPDTTGFELCRRWRSDERFRDQRVVFCTGRDAGEVREQVLELGATGFVSKPFSPEYLRGYVNSVLTGSTLGEE